MTEGKVFLAEFQIEFKQGWKIVESVLQSELKLWKFHVKEEASEKSVESKTQFIL